jgi:hypothetical protein
MFYTKKNLLFSILCFISTAVFAQQTEFPKEFVTHLRLHSGMTTNKGSAPDIFVGGLQVIPEYTIVEHKLRGGIIAGAFYSYSEINGLFGPTLSLKITEFQGGHFGTLGNLYINLDHLWGTDKQRLLGGGINLDLLNKLVVSLTAHRDYKWNQWWIQSGIAFRISKVKQPKENFPN